MAIPAGELMQFNERLIELGREPMDPTQMFQPRGVPDETIGVVVDCSTVVATHLSHLMQLHAAKLLGRVETQQLVEHVTKLAPKLIEQVEGHAEVRIRDVTLVGQYALQIAFESGHATGIYTFSLLRHLV